MIRDQEIDRLVNYIKGLGLKVVFSSKKTDYSAIWYLDNSQITICKSENVSKLETVLSLIHETGHAIHNIHEKNRQVDPKFVEALDHIDEAEELGLDTKKKHRRNLLNNEIAGTKYWHSIYRETNMKFPIWKLDAAMEFDIWMYQVFFETGEYPKTKEKAQKNKEILRKYRPKNG